jgi:hypothetical protein
MSTIRATKAYQTQSKSEVSSATIHSSKPVEESHSLYNLQNSLESSSNRSYNNNAIAEDNTEKKDQSNFNTSQLKSSSAVHQKKLAASSSSHQNDVEDVDEKSDFLKVKSDDGDDDHPQKERAFSLQGAGMGINTVTVSILDENKEDLSTLLSAAMASLSSAFFKDDGTSSLPQGPDTNALIDEVVSSLASVPSLPQGPDTNALIDEVVSSLASVPSLSQGLDTNAASDGESATTMNEFNENKLSSLDEVPGFSTSSLANQSISNFKNEGSIGSSDALGGKIPASLASAIRTGNVSTFLSELTSTVDRARLNSSNGQDISFQFRSDVLDATTVHINANTEQMEVFFSTRSLASNDLLNANIATLQNHLATLCSGQTVEVKTQFLPSSSSSEFSNQREAENDFASLNQENRGHLNDDKDTL